MLLKGPATGVNVAVSRDTDGAQTLAQTTENLGFIYLIKTKDVPLGSNLAGGVEGK